MPDHDPFFKRLLHRFFADFVQIVAPEAAGELRLDEVTFLENEEFTDQPRGRHRLLDLVAQVETRTGESEIVLVHVEIEAKARGTMSRRMWRYAMQLRLRHERPVIPIVLYLRGGPPDVTRQVVEERFGDLPLGSFVYLAFGLSGSDAGRYLERSEPLAWGLTALMRRGRLQGVPKKLRSLTKIAEEANLDEEARFLLVDCVETYVQLSDAEEEELRALLAEEENQKVTIMEKTWSERLRQEGEEKGLQKGRQEGEERGRIDGMQTLLLDMLKQRFGDLDQEVERRVRAISSPEELSRLAGEVVAGRRPPKLRA